MKIHTVKKAETLADIAAANKVSPAELISQNALSSARISPGQSLIIPAEPALSRGSMEICAFFSHSPGLDALCRSMPSYTYTALWSHSFSQSGQLLPPAAEFPLPMAREFGCGPLLCLANLNRGGGFSPELAHRLFSDEAMKATLMDELMQKLSAGAYYGVQLCFNYLFPFDKDNYSAFAEALSNTLHKAGFILSVELAPRDSAALSAGQDYAALGAAADRLSLMFCRWAHPFSPPQAMAGLDALHRALSEATAAIPAKKLLLGISGKAYDWFLPWRQGDRAKPLSNLRAPELAAAMASEIKRDKSSGAPYFLYRDAEQKRHIVFYEDYISLSEKLSLVSQYGLCGLSLYSAECFSAPALQLITQRYSAEKLL